jgi:hypothetical protein
MAWSHVQKRIAARFFRGPKRSLAAATGQAERILRQTEERILAGSITLAKNIAAPFSRGLLDSSPPPFLLAHSNSILAGAGSVFNLAGTVDEPIVGPMQRGVTTIDEALELLAFYEDQAERILVEAEVIMLVRQMDTASSRVSGPSALSSLAIMLAKKSGFSLEQLLLRLDRKKKDQEKRTS